MKIQSNNKQLGLISLAMIPVSIVGAFVFSLIFLAAPVGIICGILAARRGNKTVGVIGAVINASLIFGLLVIWILAASSKTD